MITAIFTMLAIALGYVIGLLQGGIHIYTDKKPLVPGSKNEEPQYNKDFSHNLPPEMQEYFTKNSGYIK